MMKFKTYLFSFWVIVVACNSAPKENPKTLIKQEVKSEQTTSSNEDLKSSSKEPNSNSEMELLTLEKFKMLSISIDSTNEYGAGDCFGKVTCYSPENFILGFDSMSCGEYGYTNTHYLLDSKKMIQAVYLKKSESLLQPNGNWKYALAERIIDFRNNQAIIREKIDTLDDDTKNIINKEFETKKITDRQTSLEHWNKEFRELWKKEESY